jgi:iron(II)-dependent oxidoreductase
VYDATETPRCDRGELPYLRNHEARDYMRAVRERALGVLDRVDLDDPADALNHGGLVWDMVARHEHQHVETMLQTIFLAEPEMYEPVRRALPRGGAPPGPKRIRVDAGPFLAGAPPFGFAYDNERPRHVREVPAFELDRLPVTNFDWLEFVADGGYTRRELWLEAGWSWRRDESAERPLYWTADGRERVCERTEPIDPARPVMHVSWFEADAFARWAGRRLPTEFEWEKAATWGPDATEPAGYPWGDEAPSARHANLDHTGFGPAPAGAYPAGASAYGVLGMTGDAWEWTSSGFDGYPGFEAFPYREYSSVFFGGDYRVLRGGSWATSGRVARASFRNWDRPSRRQIFAGLRLANDA